MFQLIRPSSGCLQEQEKKHANLFKYEISKFGLDWNGCTSDYSKTQRG